MRVVQTLLQSDSEVAAPNGVAASDCWCMHQAALKCRRSNLLFTLDSTEEWW